MSSLPKNPTRENFEALVADVLVVDACLDRTAALRAARLVLDALEGAGWEGPPMLCDQDGCDQPASCGTPTPDGYRHTCFEHRPAAV